MPDHTVLMRWLGLGLIILSVLFATPILAATRYVSDQLSVNLRAGPGVQYRIERSLAAGARIQTLGTSGGWTKVRTPGGRVGYVLSRLLSDQPAARARVTKLKNRISQLQSANATLKKNLERLLAGTPIKTGDKSTLAKKNRSLNQQLRNIRQTSADALRIARQNADYRQRIIRLKTTIDRLKSQQQTEEWRREIIKLSGLVLFAGLLLALLLPWLPRRRKRPDGWSSL